MPLIPVHLNAPIILPWGEIARGKVRTMLTVPGHDELIGQWVNDYISVFDVVLGFTVPNKGQILNALTIYFKHALEAAKIVKTDLVAYGAEVDAYLAPELRGNPEIQSRLTIVRKHKPIMFECIVRGRLWGSAVKDYDPETGMLHGQFVGKGLKAGDLFETPIFDPTTKAAHGEHDKPVSVEEVEAKYPGLGKKSIEIFLHLRGLSRARGFELVDTKFEFAWLYGEFILLDEVATMDSSRFWLMADLANFDAGRIKKIPELSKEYARVEAERLGIKQLANEKRWDEAQQIMFSRQQISAVGMIYRWMFMRLTGVCLETYWQTARVNLHDKRVILVIAGSKSDDPQQEAGVAFLKSYALYHRHVCSCHGSPAELLAIVGMIKHGEFGDIKAIIAGAGMAAHLPGMLKAFLTMYKIGHIPVLGVGFLSGAAEATDAVEHGKLINREMAAFRSIDQLPGQPVEVQPNGFAFAGPEGFLDACLAAAKREFLPKLTSKRDAILFYGEDDERVLGEAEALALVRQDIGELEEELSVV